MPQIEGLRCLDEEGHEWEWRVDGFDFHVRLEHGQWVLEQFDSAVPDAETAHVREQECESLADALLCSLHP